MSRRRELRWSSSWSRSLPSPFSASAPRSGHCWRGGPPTHRPRGPKNQGPSTYQIHSKKKDVDLKAGDILTFEGGLGKTFYAKVDGTPLPRITSVGLVYYSQFKVTGDVASALTPLIEGKKDHVFGVGVEANVFLPKPKLLIGFRAVQEFGVVNRTQGLTLMVMLGTKPSCS